MSKRSNEKRVTLGSKTLKFLREQAGLSTRGAAAASGLGDSVINHLEHGRMDLLPRHLDKLLPAYKTTAETWEMFSSGRVALPHDLRSDCIEIIKNMPILSNSLA